MTNYRRGADLERQVRTALYDTGAALVLRSAGSKSPVDLVGWWQAQDGMDVLVWFIQVKRTGKLYASARADFVELAHKCGATPVLATKRPRRPVTFQVLEAKQAA